MCQKRERAPAAAVEVEVIKIFTEFIFSCPDPVLVSTLSSIIPGTKLFNLTSANGLGELIDVKLSCE
jgi:hypothetical protein